MKIAILSMQKVYNYGSVLQAYSLMKILEKITGENIEFINPNCNDFIKVNMKIKDSNDYLGEKYITNKIEFLTKKIINKIKYKNFVRKIKEFQNNELKLNDDNIKKEYDIVIEGSDEVFKCTDKLYLHMYGKVNNTKKLITYAASCGSANAKYLTKEQCNILKKTMSNFKTISVRDNNTLKYIKNFYNGKVEKHLDPVLIGDLNLIEHKPVKEKNYMIIYAYGDRIKSAEEIKAIKNYAKKKGLKTIAIGAPQYWCDKFISVSPFEMLDYFYFSDCVVTDTFHGTIFSIINQCNFVTIFRKTNNNKLGDLLESLDLDERKLKNTKDLELVLNKKIDYKKIDKKLAREKEKTINYLKDNIL